MGYKNIIRQKITGNETFLWIKQADSMPQVQHRTAIPEWLVQLNNLIPENTGGIWGREAPMRGKSTSNA